MNEAGDKLVTNAGSGVVNRKKITGCDDGKGAKSVRKSRSGKQRKPGPVATVKSGSTGVPIYQSESKGRVRFTLSFYRDGRRVRKVFVAQRIQVGMQHVTDLKPHERDSFKAAEAMLQKSGIPLVAAVEDYLRARDLAGTESLAAMASEYGQHFKKVVRKATIPAIVAEMLLHRKQDGASKVYLGQLKTTLNRFAARFPGEILDATSQEIDAWLRSLEVAPGTRNSMLRCIKVFFSFPPTRPRIPRHHEP
jgi:hypothetical protein